MTVAEEALAIQNKHKTNKPTLLQKLQKKILESITDDTVKLSNKESKKQNFKLLSFHGLRVDYNLFGAQAISIAYKWNFDSGNGSIFFTVRSNKDQFCRASALTSLVKHMKENSNEIKFRSGGINRKILKKKLIESLSERMESKPYRFPSKLIKLFKKECIKAKDGYRYHATVENALEKYYE
jgi:hypothetical protein